MKDEFKGTKGQWTNHSLFTGEARTSIWSGDIYVAEVMSVRESESVKKANSNIIVSAPELLEALRQLRDYVEDVCAVSSDDCHEDHPLNLANKEIKKALGKKQ